MKKIILCILTSLCFLNHASAEEEKGFNVQELRFGAGVVAERWADPTMSVVYGKQGKAIPMVYLSYRFHKRFALDAEAGMARLTANVDRNVFQVVPVTVGGSLLFLQDNPNVEPFVGVGAGFVQYTERVLPYILSTTPSVNYGTKLGTDFRAGVRIGTRFVQTSQHPNAPTGPNKMDVELMIGQRVHHAFGIGAGLNLSAFRASIGLKFRI
jgi:hypothetical protein